MINLRRIVLRPLFGNKTDQPRDATLVPDRIVRILTMADL